MPRPIAVNPQGVNESGSTPFALRIGTGRYSGVNLWGMADLLAGLAVPSVRVSAQTGLTPVWLGRIASGSAVVSMD